MLGSEVTVYTLSCQDVDLATEQEVVLMLCVPAFVMSGLGNERFLWGKLQEHLAK